MKILGCILKMHSTEVWIPNNRGEYNERGELVLSH